MEHNYTPMMATLGSSKISNGYIYELKIDGVRAICYVDGDIELITRNSQNYSSKFPELKFRKQINAQSCVLDGELVVFDEKGNPDFPKLMSREPGKKPKDHEIATYIVFDILEKDGKSLVFLPIEKRKEILESTIIEDEFLQKMVFTEDQKKLWEFVKARKLEGLIAKKKGSIYEEGRRSDSWIKIKILQTIDCVIVGFTSEKRKISALALALYDDKKLKFIGMVGTGFNDKLIEQLHAQLSEIRSESPTAIYNLKKQINWVKPKFVCEVEYLKVTKDLMLRAPSFKGLRADKPLSECTFDTLA